MFMFMFMFSIKRSISGSSGSSGSSYCCLFFILLRMVISCMYMYICVFVKMDGRYLVYVCNHCWLTSITHNRDIPYLPHNYYTYFDHIDTCTSPTCSLSSINMQSLDCPIPPPIVNGN